MWNILMKINRNLVYAIPAFLLGGLIFGSAVEPTTAQKMKTLIVPFTLLMVYPMMVTLNIQHLRQGLQPRIQLSALFLNFAIIPFVAYFLGRACFSDQPYMALGLLLASLLPTSGMTISWTGFAKGNVGAAINMTVIGLTLGSLVTPLYVSGLLGAVVEVDFLKVTQQIIFIVFLPMVLGYLTRQAFLKRYSMAEFKERIAPRFPALSTVGVLGVVFVAMSLKARSILADPGNLLAIFLPLVALYLVNFTISTIAGRLFFNRGDGIALVYGTVMRNLSIALAIAINAFGQAGTDAALVIALAYIIQVQSAAWYVKCTDRFFGTVATPEVV
jgi:ACR3 family arsenite efflux pump ArsB